METYFELRSVRGEGDTWIVEGQAGYEGGDPMPFVDIPPEPTPGVPIRIRGGG